MRRRRACLARWRSPSSRCDHRRNNTERELSSLLVSGGWVSVLSAGDERVLAAEWRHAASTSSSSESSSAEILRRASARIGSASLSSAKPLAMVTKLPERSDFGNGFAPQVGWPPSVVGSIQIWKILVGFGSRLYSEWRMP